MLKGVIENLLTVLNVNTNKKYVISLPKRRIAKTLELDNVAADFPEQLFHFAEINKSK